MKRKFARSEDGFLSAKVAMITAGSILATASIGVASVSFINTHTEAALNAATGSGVCVTAEWIDDASIETESGNCSLADTPIIPDPDPIIPDPNPIIPPVDKIMTSTWNTTLPGCKTITLPINSLKGDIDWNGESASSGANQGRPTYTFKTTSPSTKITIDGEFLNWGYNGWATHSKCLVSVDKWGETGTTFLNYGFYDADNLKHVEEIPSTITDLSVAFFNVDSDFTLGKPNASNFTLNTSSVTNMGGMFQSATKFNQPLKFDTAKVTEMSTMFSSATAFNSPINFTDTSKVENIFAIFQSATAFNQPINFNTSSVKGDFRKIFYNASSFNQPINFNTDKAKDMTAMFQGATAFNSSVKFSSTPLLENTSYMFHGATAFNQPLNFNTSNVTNMSAMFAYASNFDQPVNFLDISKLTSLAGMFTNATAFNQSLSHFNTSKITNATSLLYNATSFKQDLSSWDFRKVVKFDNTFTNSPMALPENKKLLPLSWQ